MFIKNELSRRSLPDILKFRDGTPVSSPDMWDERRREILDLLANEEYGISPNGPFDVTGEITYRRENDYAGKISSEKIRLTIRDRNISFSYMVYLCVPVDAVTAPVPLFVHIAFRDNVPDQYMPVEEICDRGCAVAMICYNDITEDKNDEFTSGIASLYDRSEYTWGKISMWAWAMSRAMDYLQNDKRFDMNKIAAVGHSRLGKTALWCGANDTRFKYVFVNDSGCSGDAVARGKSGERISDITRSFPIWFCNNYMKYAGNEVAMPFDQHFLVAACAPRAVYGGTAENDLWADPCSQYLSYCAAGEVYRLLGQSGLIAPDRYPQTNEVFSDGSIGFHMRSGEHFFSRYDWNRYMDFLLK